MSITARLGLYESAVGSIGAQESVKIPQLSYLNRK